MSTSDKLEAIHEDIGEIKKALFGNGREGVLDRVTRVEESQGKVSWKYLITIAIAIGAWFK